jgi:hypothetical protein
VCKFWRKENISNLGSRKTISYVERVSVEQKAIKGKTELTKYETTFKIS